MPDLRPWPSAKPSAAALSMAAERAAFHRRATSAEARAFLRGIQMAQAAAVTAAEELYDEADQRDAEGRREGNARAAGAKLAAARIDALLVAAAEVAGPAPSRRGAKALLKKLMGKEE